jgi:hypothetical protein
MPVKHGCSGSFPGGHNFDPTVHFRRQIAAKEAGLWSGGVLLLGPKITFVKQARLSRVIEQRKSAVIFTYGVPSSVRHPSRVIK